MKKLLFAILLMLLLAPAHGRAAAPKPINAEEKKAVVNAVADVLARQYVFPERPRKWGT